MGSRRNQYVSSFVAMMGMICSGLHLGWSSPNLPKLLDGTAGFTINRDESSWVASLFLMGSVIGCLAAKLYIDRIGRKITITLSAFPYVLSWIIIMLSWQAWHLYCAQISAGIALGMGLVVTGTYTGEIAEKQIRGALAAVVNFGINIGGLFSWCIGPFLSYTQVTIACIVIPFLFFILSFWIPESPYFHLMKGDKQKAEKVLMRLRCENKPEGVSAELDEMEEFVKEDLAKRGGLKELFGKKVYRKSIMIIIVIRSLQQLCGNIAIQQYLEIIFNATGIDIPASTVVIIYGVVQVISGVLATILTDRLGRKPLLYFSSIGHSISLTAIGAYFFMKEYLHVDPAVLSSISWIPLASLILYCICYSVGIGSLAYILLAEYFPTNVKGIAVCCGSIYGSFLSFAVSKVFLPFADATGVYTALWVFAAFCYASIPYTYYCVPETKNTSFAEIQAVLNKGSLKTEINGPEKI